MTSEDRYFTVLEMASAYGISQILHVAALLQLGQYLAPSPKRLSTLAELSAADEQALRHLMNALVGMGIATESDDAGFGLTALGRMCLAPEADGSVEPLIRYLMHPTCWMTWGHLLYTVKTGKPAFPTVFGSTAWEYRSHDPELDRIFNAAVGTISNRQQEAICSAYDFSARRRIVDVGGGNGTLIAHILAHAPASTGVLLDLPHVVTQARSVLQTYGVADRCEIVGGDFFVDVPPGGDLYVMRAVLHNWDDRSAMAILRSCRRAMSGGTRLLLVEGISKAPAELNGHFWPSFLDLHMLVIHGGRQRTAAEFQQLFAASQLSLTRTISLPGHYDLLEAELV